MTLWTPTYLFTLLLIAEYVSSCVNMCFCKFSFVCVNCVLIALYFSEFSYSIASICCAWVAMLFLWVSCIDVKFSSRDFISSYSVWISVLKVAVEFSYTSLACKMSFVNAMSFSSSDPFCTG